MLIPKFELSQSDSKLIITIYAPYVDINNTEIYYKDNDFRFISNPYYLHLNLPGKLMVMEQPSAQYLCDGHKFIFAVDKAVQGDHFQDLDMISLFIVKKKTYTFCPRIEPLDSEGTSDYSLSDVSDEENIIDLNEEEEDLQAEGACALQPVVVVKPKYGFGNRFSNVFLGFTHKIRKLCDLPDPDGTPTSARRQLKMEKELKDFREENYLANFFQKEVTDLVIKYKALWQRQNFEATASLTTKEFNKLKEIPRHAWSAEKHTFIYLGLIDILLAFCYDNRITEGDPTSESAWTINKLSSTLSWFEKFETVESVLISFMRRSLCYPLFRSWDLSLKVVADVESLLRCNKLYIQKCLLQIHSLFNASEPHYMLNRIYMDDYCQWIAYAKPKDLQSIADDIAKIKLHKNDVGLNLVALEGAAQLELEKRTDQTAATVLPPYPSVSSMDELAACLEKLTIADIRKDDKPPSNDSDMDFDNDELSNIENGQDTSECSEGGFEADDEESPDSDDSNKILILIYDGTADIPQPDLNEGASHNALYRYWSV